MPLVVLLERGAPTERARGITHSRLANDISQRRPSGKTQRSQLVEFLQGCPVASTRTCVHARTHTHKHTRINVHQRLLYDTHKHQQPPALSTDASLAPH